ncbi:MAG: DNA alkylation repair protein, partial [Oscillospiraceae bacterium]|nr:DNA alkylation repair protein [Oscillospiraceae bacterium]
SPEYLAIPAAIHSDEYYINMMIAWFYATALAKRWEDSLPYIENGTLDSWVHNKTIQKACESYRISDERKAYLKKFRK